MSICTKEAIKEIIPDPSTPEGREYRRNKIGSSDAGVIMGLKPFGKTVRNLFDEKIGLRAPVKTNKAMRRGIELEPYIRESLSLEWGIPLQSFSNIHRERSWQISSLDGWNEKENRAVEIKVAGREDHSKAECGLVPEKYIPQLQHHMCVHDLDKITYVSVRFSASDISDKTVFDVYRDEAYIKSLLLAEKDFWHRLQDFEPPEEDLREYEDLSTNTNFILWIKEYDAAYRQYKEAEERADEAKKMLVAMSGDKNCKGNGYSLSRHVRKGSVQYKDIPELEKVNLDRYRSSPIEYWQLKRCVI